MAGWARRPKAASFEGVVMAALCCHLAGYLAWGARADPVVFQAPVESLPLSRLAVHSQSGMVFVGGNNYLARLSPDLQLMESTHLRAASATDMASGKLRVRVLEIDHVLGRLLVCRQEAHCLCSTHSLENVMAVQETVVEVTLTCSERTVAIFLPGGTPAANDSDLLLASPFRSPAPVLALLTLAVEADAAASSLRFVQTQGRSSFTGQSSYPFEIGFVHGFVHKNFTYLVSVQEDDFILPRANVSKISRLCNSRKSVLPYVEMHLDCKHDQKVYKVATAARLARIPNGARTDDVLIVSFVENTDALRNPRAGSLVCVFLMENIERIMNGILQNLYDSKPARWISLNHSREEHTLTNITLQVCEKDIARSRDTSEDELELGTVVLRLPDEVVSGVQAVNLRGAMFNIQRVDVLLVTTLGQLKQFNITSHTYKDKWEVYRSYNLTTKSILWSDSGVHSTNVYVSTNSSIYRETWALYPEFPECEACVDDSSRQWCQGRCQLRGTEGCGSWRERTCPPEISAIRPTSGPKSGGTLLTILGKRLGTSKKYVSITVCDRPCSVVFINLTSIQCRTSPATSDPYVCPVSLRVNETNSNASRVNLFGRAIAPHNFSYDDPILTGLRPIRGPLSGGTLLTISATGLRRGAVVIVHIGSREECVNPRCTEREIVCTTPPLPTTNATVFPFGLSVSVTLDGHTFTVNSTFSYERDPEITDIRPLKSITSGGLNITVIGTNLDVIARPRIGLKPPGSLSVTANVSTEDCTVKNGAELMVCPSPNAANVSRDGKAEIFFLMDGVESLRNFSHTHPSLSQLIVHPDPVVPKPSSTLILDPASEDRLQLEVTGLKDAVPPSQIFVSIGDSTCGNLEVSDTHVTCDVKSWREANTENKTEYPVVIKIGRLKLSVGNVQLMRNPNRGSTTSAPGPLDPPFLFIIIAVGAVVFIALVLIVSLYMCTVRRIAGKNLHDEYSMVSTNTEMTEFKTITGIIDPAKIKLVETSGVLIKKEHLQLGECVGEGNFGCVYVGYLAKQDTQTKVAVKTLRDTDTQSVNLNDFLEEALLMKDFSHPNVLNLIGIAFSEDRLPLVVLPFVDLGDLLSYVSDWHNELTVLDIIRFGLDVANGMAYLSNLKFVHRDLAARNCMLESDMRVRVADFGLCRDIYEKGYYHSDNRKKLPIRWMSIESIEGGTYTSKSDVWSLGVVLWELFTRGVTPYPGVEGWDIARFLRAGRRLEQPWFCPTSVYDLMKSCWMEEPSSRPSFPDIRERLQEIRDIQESNVDEGIYLTLGDCARYQNVADIMDPRSAYFVLESSSEPSSPFAQQH